MKLINDVVNNNNNNNNDDNDNDDDVDDSNLHDIVKVLIYPRGYCWEAYCDLDHEHVNC